MFCYYLICSIAYQSNLLPVISFLMCSCYESCAARRSMQPNRSSGQQALQIPASVSAPASAVMCQPSQQDAQSSMGSSPRHPFVTINHHGMDYLGRSATPLAHSRGAGMGSGIAYHAPESHLHSVVNPLPASGLQLGIASLEQ